MTTASAQPIPMPADWRDFLALTKPRVMSLVIFTGLCGLLAAPGPVNPVIGFTAILCIALGAGGSAALNMWWEADLDAKMKRTAARPLPAGRMERSVARDFGVALSVGSVLIMGLAVGWLAAAVLAFSIFYYAVIYTVWLKPPHVQVRQQRRDWRALRYAAVLIPIARRPSLVPAIVRLFHRRFYPHLDQMQHVPVRDPACYRFHQRFVRNFIERRHHRLPIPESFRLRSSLPAGGIPSRGAVLRSSAV